MRLRNGVTLNDDCSVAVIIPDAGLYGEKASSSMDLNGLENLTMDATGDIAAQIADIASQDATRKRTVIAAEKKAVPMTSASDEKSEFSEAAPIKNGDAEKLPSEQRIQPVIASVDPSENADNATQSASGRASKAKNAELRPVRLTSVFNTFKTARAMTSRQHSRQSPTTSTIGGSDAPTAAAETSDDGFASSSKFLFMKNCQFSSSQSLAAAGRTALSVEASRLVNILSLLRESYSTCFPAVSYRFHWLRVVSATTLEELSPYQVIFSLRDSEKANLLRLDANRMSVEISSESLPEPPPSNMISVKETAPFVVTEKSSAEGKPLAEENSMSFSVNKNEESPDVDRKAVLSAEIPPAEIPPAKMEDKNADNVDSLAPSDEEMVDASRHTDERKVAGAEVEAATKRNSVTKVAVSEQPHVAIPHASNAVMAAALKQAAVTTNTRVTRSTASKIREELAMRADNVESTESDSTASQPMELKPSIIEESTGESYKVSPSLSPSQESIEFLSRTVPAAASSDRMTQALVSPLIAGRIISDLNLLFCAHGRNSTARLGFYRGHAQVTAAAETLRGMAAATSNGNLSSTDANVGNPGDSGFSAYDLQILKWSSQNNIPTSFDVGDPASLPKFSGSPLLRKHGLSGVTFRVDKNSDGVRIDAVDAAEGSTPVTAGARGKRRTPSPDLAVPTTAAPPRASTGRSNRATGRNAPQAKRQRVTPANVRDENALNPEDSLKSNRSRTSTARRSPNTRSGSDSPVATTEKRVTSTRKRQIKTEGVVPSTALSLNTETAMVKSEGTETAIVSASEASVSTSGIENTASNVLTVSPDDTHRLIPWEELTEEDLEREELRESLLHRAIRLRIWRLNPTARLPKRVAPEDLASALLDERQREVEMCQRQGIRKRGRPIGSNNDYMRTRMMTTYT